MEHSDTTASAAHLRHALRTPLNHIIGYSEIVAEEIRDSVFPSDSAWALTLLDGIVSNAKELVRFVQNALPPSATELSDKQVADLQSWLQPHVLGMIGQVGEIQGIDPRFSHDLARIESAIRKLLAFCEGQTHALNEEALLQSESLHTPRISPTRGTLLVVDDSPHNRDILRRNLERIGYTVETVGEGATALQRLRDSVFDLVLLDVLMPGMDGYSVIRELKASVDMKHIPVIVISAVDESSAVIRCVQMGAEDYIMKPFDAVLVRVRVNAAIDRWRTRARLSLVGSNLEILARQLNNGLDEVLREEIRRLIGLCDQETV